MANIVIGVTGSIAAYKAVDLTSKLIQNGHEVKVVLTDNAGEFITPLAFQAIGRNHVYTDTFKEEDPSVISHINIGEWADLIIVAPISANTISKLACGIYDNMLLNVLAANTKPVMLAPAMNVHMYEQPAIQRNIGQLLEEGYQVLDAESGFLACGYNAKGRMANVPDIMGYVEDFLSSRDDKPLKGKKVLITAGPTREALDPIRYVTNHSSGKMGYSLANSFKGLGADVVLVSGPVSLAPPNGVRTIGVISTEDMFSSVKKHMDADIGVFSAAVSDYTPVTYSEGKMKKTDDSDNLIVEMKKTTDILKYVGHNSENMTVIGFAAETDDVKNYALKKLKEKNADGIIMNDVSDPEIGMNSDDNEVAILYKDGTEKYLEKASKVQLANQIVQNLADHYGWRS